MTEIRRETRHEVTMQGRYRTGSGLARDVVVTDLSTTGCKFEDRVNNLRTGSIISIRIGNIGPITAHVQWMENSTIGVRFDSTLHASVLDHMLVTIEGWTAANKASEPQPVQVPQRLPGSPNGHLVRVRAATPDDARESLRRAGLSLPVASHQDLVEVFDHLLKIVTIAPTTGSGEQTG